jgi:predicted DNA-binding protein (MmcQ/YjbR family)
MNIETIREYCLSKNGVTESFPFDEFTLVFKVMGKIFLLINLDGEPTINVKCDPEKAIELRELYPSVLPGYHMNKKHWNTVKIDGSLTDKLINSFIDHSYNLVFDSLPKKIQNEKTGT